MLMLMLVVVCDDAPPTVPQYHLQYHRVFKTARRAMNGPMASSSDILTPAPPPSPSSLFPTYSFYGAWYVQVRRNLRAH